MQMCRGQSKLAFIEVEKHTHQLQILQHSQVTFDVFAENSEYCAALVKDLTALACKASAYRQLTETVFLQLPTACAAVNLLIECMFLVPSDLVGLVLGLGGRACSHLG